MRALVLLMRIVVALSLAAMLQNRRADKQLTARIIAVILVLKLVSLVLALSLAAMLQNQRADKQLTVWIIAVILVPRSVRLVPPLILLTKFVILSASASQWSVAIQVIVPVLVLSMLIVLQNLVRVIVN